MSEMPETGAAATNVAAAPESAPVSPGPAPAGTQAPVSPRRYGRRLLLILFVVTSAVAVAAAAVTVVLVTQRPGPAHSLRATVFRLHPGQCFNSLPNGIAGAHAVPCRQPHDGEIYGEFRVAGQNWPGAAALGEQARQGCQGRLSGYLNPQLDTSGMADSYAYPNEGAWQAGVRSVICEIRSTQGKLTGSVRASGG